MRGDSLEEGVVSYSLLVEVDSGDDIIHLLTQLRQHPNIYLVERQ